MLKINELLKKFCEEKNVELIFTKQYLQACNNSELLNKEKHSIFIIIKEQNENDLMIRDLENPIIRTLTRENAPKNCFYCQFGCSIKNNDFLRVIVVEDNKKAYVFSKETVSERLHCPNSTWGDED